MALPRLDRYPDRVDERRECGRYLAAGFDRVDAGPLGIAYYTEPFALLIGELAYGGVGGPEVAYRFQRFGQRD